MKGWLEDFERRTGCHGCFERVPATANQIALCNEGDRRQCFRVLPQNDDDDDDDDDWIDDSNVVRMLLVVDR